MSDPLKDMKAEDRARAAARILDDWLAMGLLELLEQRAIATMIEAQDERAWREARDTVVTIRDFVRHLRDQVVQFEEARRKPPEIV